MKHVSDISLHLSTQEPKLSKQIFVPGSNEHYSFFKNIYFLFDFGFFGSFLHPIFFLNEI